MDAPVWDLYCRVVDNLGDIGVCWRLAVDLGSRGVRVRLWIDDAAPLAWMAPGGAAGVEVRPWPAEGAAAEHGDVVVEAFGCELPPAVVARMAAAPRPVVWIDLEYLTAEAHAQRSHGLGSPQTHGPGAGLVRWFFFPGFVDGTGGLLREPRLLERRAAFDRTAWLAQRGIRLRPGERVVSVFSYTQLALPALIDTLANAPTLLLPTPGFAAAGVAQALGQRLQRGDLRAIALSWLTQADFDALLWSSDLNLVRGEDSFVRAQWAGAPFVWQAYVQDDGAHHAKVDAFLALHLAHAAPGLRGAIERLWRAWNGGAPIGSALALPDAAGWTRHCAHWRERLACHTDLTTRLLDFATRHG